MHQRALGQVAVTIASRDERSSWDRSIADRRLVAMSRVSCLASGHEDASCHDGRVNLTEPSEVDGESRRQPAVSVRGSP
jgi:hypothetical protein